MKKKEPFFVHRMWDISVVCFLPAWLNEALVEGQEHWIGRRVKMAVCKESSIPNIL